LRAAAWIWVVEADGVGAVEVGVADVAAWLATFLVVEWVDIDPFIGDGRASVRESGDEGGEGEIGGDYAVVCSAVVVLNFLEEEDVRGSEVVDDLSGDIVERVVRRIEVFDDL
jgi:hypothetical protein